MCVRFVRCGCEWWPDSQCYQGPSDSRLGRQDSRAEAGAKSAWSVVSETLDTERLVIVFYVSSPTRNAVLEVW